MLRILAVFVLMMCSTSFEVVPSLPKSSSVVYSLATVNGGGNRNTMNYNIVTYAHQMSIKPASWAVSLYKGTKSHMNLFENGVGVLQTLPSDFNLDAISLLGKRSGFDVDKTAELDSLGVEREDIKVEGIDRPISIFKNSISFAVMMVDRNQPVIDLGDHDMVIMTPRQYFSGHPGSPLTTQYLRDRGVI